jgi:hypothetical protein
VDGTLFAFRQFIALHLQRFHLAKASLRIRIFTNQSPNNFEKPELHIRNVLLGKRPEKERIFILNSNPATAGRPPKSARIRTKVVNSAFHHFWYCPENPD